MTDRELMQMALDALNNFDKGNHGMRWQVPIIKALRSRLANEFNPDWNQVEALQESLREHMAEIQRLRAALAQPEQEPVAWKMKGVPAFATSRPNDTDSIKWDALYTAPPQREWQGLTDKEIENCFEMSMFGTCRTIEAKLKEKNAPYL